MALKVNPNAPKPDERKNKAVDTYWRQRGKVTPFPTKSGMSGSPPIPKIKSTIVPKRKEVPAAEGSPHPKRVMTKDDDTSNVTHLYCVFKVAEMLNAGSG